jgi:WD40 repeat protein
MRSGRFSGFLLLLMSLFLLAPGADAQDSTEGRVPITRDNAGQVVALCAIDVPDDDSYPVNMVLSPDNAQLVSISWDRPALRVWDITSGELAELSSNWRYTMQYEQAYSPDGRLLAISAGNQIELWDVTNHQTVTTLETLPDENNTVTEIAISSDGTLLANSDFGGVRLWDMAAHETVAVYDMDALGITGRGVRRVYVGFTTDNTLLVAAATGDAVLLVDLATGEAAPVSEGLASSRILAFSPDLSRVAVVETEGEIAVWDVANAELATVLKEQPAPLFKAAFSPDGTLLVTSYPQNADARYPPSEATVWLWDTATGESVAELHGHRGWIAALAFSPDGTLLASGGSDHSLRLWGMPVEGSSLCPDRPNG